MQTRTCAANCHGTCPGPSTNTLASPCLGGPPAEWTAYTLWSPCSAQCGPGRRNRTRTCTANCHGDCAGSGLAEAPCQGYFCPLPAPPLAHVVMQANGTVAAVRLPALPAAPNLPAVTQVLVRAYQLPNTSASVMAGAAPAQTLSWGLGWSADAVQNMTGLVYGLAYVFETAVENAAGWSTRRTAPISTTSAGSTDNSTRTSAAASSTGTIVGVVVVLLVVAVVLCVVWAMYRSRKKRTVLLDQAELHSGSGSQRFEAFEVPNAMFLAPNPMYKTASANEYAVPLAEGGEVRTRIYTVPLEDNPMYGQEEEAAMYASTACKPTHYTVSGNPEYAVTGEYTRAHHRTAQGASGSANSDSAVVMYDHVLTSSAAVLYDNKFYDNNLEPSRAQDECLYDNKLDSAWDWDNSAAYGILPGAADRDGQEDEGVLALDLRNERLYAIPVERQRAGSELSVNIGMSSAV